MDEKNKSYDDAALFAELANKYLNDEPVDSSAHQKDEQTRVSPSEKVLNAPEKKQAPLYSDLNNAAASSKPVYFSNHNSDKIDEKTVSSFSRRGQPSSVFSSDNYFAEPEASQENVLPTYPDETVEEDPELKKYQERRAKRRAYLKKHKGKLHINIDASKFTKNTYIFFAVVISLSIIVSVYAVFCVNDVLAIMKNKDSISVSVSEENIEDVNSVIDLLHDYRLINCPLFCKTFIHILRSDIFVKNSSGERIQYTQGTFDLNPKMGLEGLLVTLQGEVAEKEIIQLTFPEGYTIPQIINKLVEEGICDEDALKAELNKAKFTYSILNDMPESENIPYRFEGYLFPDTYEFYLGENPNSIIEKFVKNLDDRFTQEMRQRAAEINMSIPEVLTLASIIQQEAANKKQMKIISGILHNRLNDPSNFPLLECNSTQDYIKHRVAPTLTASSPHTSDYYFNFYNTYPGGVGGLPLAPICNPGMDAIDAALNPEVNNLYFFCHDNKREMYTARTVEEHNANIAKYQVNTKG